MPKKRAHSRPVYLKNKPYHLVKIPWVQTTGMPECPCEYNNGLHAAVGSIIAAMQMDDLCHAITWMTQARRQLNHALRSAKKPGASVPVVGQVYDYPENVQIQP